MGRNLWYLYQVPVLSSRALWFDEAAGNSIPAELPPAGSAAPTLPDLAAAVPLAVEREREDRFHVRARTEAGWAYMAEPRVSGWKAWLNGAPIVSERALSAFQKIPVPAGRWEIDFLYDPPSWRWGVFLSVSTLLAAASYSLRNLMKIVIEGVRS
jgi:hypothetical protein